MTAEPVSSLPKINLQSHLGSGITGTVHTTDDPDIVCKRPNNIGNASGNNDPGEGTLREVSSLIVLQDSPYVTKMVTASIGDEVKESKSVGSKDLEGRKNGICLYLCKYTCDLQKYFTSRKNSLTSNEILWIGYCVLRALYDAERLSISHRDVKLENILIRETVSSSDAKLNSSSPPSTLGVGSISSSPLTTGTGAGRADKIDQVKSDGRPTVVLADWGNARFAESLAASNYTNPVQTLWYRAPEMLMDPEGLYSHSINVWSVGVILYELYTGVHMVCGKDEREQLLKTFQLFGTPTEATWPGCSEMEAMSSEVKSHPDGRKYRVASTIPLYPIGSGKFKSLLNTKGNVPAPVIELINKMLTMDPSKRISTGDALCQLCRICQTAPGFLPATSVPTSTPTPATVASSSAPTQVSATAMAGVGVDATLAAELESTIRLTSTPINLLDEWKKHSHVLGLNRLAPLNASIHPTGSDTSDAKGECKVG